MNDRRFGTIIQIGDILVSEDVVCEYFACDYAKCKGRCCIEGEGGAPVLGEEIGELLDSYEDFAPMMSEEGRKVVSEKGMACLEQDGELGTPLMGEHGACAFTRMENGSCLCAIECAGCRKPVSCSLYPIRVTRLTGGGQALNLHRWDICKDAFRKGREEHIRAYRFLKKPIIAAYGKEFYEALHAAAKHINGD